MVKIDIKGCKIKNIFPLGYKVYSENALGVKTRPTELSIRILPPGLANTHDRPNLYAGMDLLWRTGGMC